MKVGLDHIVQRDIYQSYLRRLDARAVLEHYGAQNCTEQSGGDGTIEIVHSCLLDRVEPHHTNGDAHPSASINIDKKTYCCYSLGFGCDLFHLVMKLEGKESFSDSLSSISQFLLGSTVEVDTLRTELDKVFTAPDAYTLSLPAYDERILASWDTPHLYWDHRGISQEAQKILHLGYDSQERRIVFPHFVDGTLVGWQKRVVPGETLPDYPKYRNSPGFPKSETLYNLDTARQSPRVLVVESPMSVARAVTLGLPNVVATFGAKVSDTQIALLHRYFDTVYVWFDRDGAGLAGEKKIVEGLHRHPSGFVGAPDGGRDLGDADLEEIADKLEQSVPASLRLGEYDLWKVTHG